MENFKLAKYKFEITSEEKIILPIYKGSTLRGGFGQIFKMIFCLNKEKNCERCFLKEKCIYTYLFDTITLKNNETTMRNFSSIPRPFIIEPPIDSKKEYDENENLNFNLILIGNAIEYLHYFIYAFQKLGKAGIGKNRGKYILKSVESIGLKKNSVIYSERDNIFNNDYRIISFKDFLKIYPNVSKNEISLKFITPTRIKYKERLTDNLEFSVFIINLLRRISLLSFFHCNEEIKKNDVKQLIEKAKEIKTLKKDLQWYDWERYSNRQHSWIKLGGFLGDITFKGDLLKEFLPYIFLGNYIHIGKGATFGLGKYEIMS